MQYNRCTLHTVECTTLARASVAVNHLVAFSDVVLGMGIIGGSVYGCGQLPDAGNTCSGFRDKIHLENKSIPWPLWVNGIREHYLADRAAAGAVAPLRHLVAKPVYLFSGLDDVWVYQSVMKAVALQVCRAVCTELN